MGVLLWRQTSGRIGHPAPVGLSENLVVHAFWCAAADHPTHIIVLRRGMFVAGIGREWLTSSDLLRSEIYVRVSRNRKRFLQCHR
ncbi:protein of unknown function [Paraburkholderia dioscoreae]|uniref:Uncharacterized protein n=1 Tax=Paraburkholderia dioscoreae TaxID=2604047 RepID=A0A5Q4ZCK1_9BURK|nr:protein of unknown function [Paraburkholderia dioscoreae]